MLSREKVEAVLFKMGMPANVKGFGYIVDGVLLLEEDSKIKTTYASGIPGSGFERAWSANGESSGKIRGESQAQEVK